MYPIETKIELKPCPFCGGTAELTYWGKNGRIVRCTSCVVQKRQRVLRNSVEWLEDKLVEGWNERTPIVKEP